MLESVQIKSFLGELLFGHQVTGFIGVTALCLSFFGLLDGKERNGIDTNEQSAALDEPVQRNAHGKSRGPFPSRLFS
jgi:hypothetical protein